jgi:hypothetical protein
VKRTMRMGTPSGFGAQSLLPMASHTCLGQLVRQPVEGQGRNKADDSFWRTLSSLYQTVVDIELRIRKLIETLSKPYHLSIPFQSAHGGCRHTCVPQFCQTCYATFSEHVQRDLTFSHGTGH